MSLHLNKNNDAFFDCRNGDIFVDKSLLIKECNNKIRKPDKFMCVTRPRRFGKTMALSMLNAYYSKGCDSRSLFSGLKITDDSFYSEHLNSHNVIWIDMASLYTGIKDKKEFVNVLQSEIIEDLKEKYQSVLSVTDDTVRKCIIKINSKLNERFIFLIDEWDVLYRESDNDSELCDEYTEFLRNLFKSSDVASCVDLVYMTGILPIRRYSTQSTLNMFTEYNMIKPRGLESYIGFTEEEVKDLCLHYHRDFDSIKAWYDGYRLNHTDIYNPKSVVEAILSGKNDDYWVETSALEAVTNYMNYDNGVLKDAICKMIIGDKVDVNVRKFENDLTKVNSTDSALTVLIHLGYLAYDEENESCYIPNFEIRQEFVAAVDSLSWKEIYNPILNSEKMYRETLNGNTKFIDETLDKNHRELAGPFNKNKEDILGVIVEISYYYMKRFYEVKKEDTSILGRSDIVFIPRDSAHVPFIVELKVDSSPANAIQQIKDREYVNSLGNYHGKVLLLGVSYDSKTLKHTSLIDWIER